MSVILWIISLTYKSFLLGLGEEHTEFICCFTHWDHRQGTNVKRSSEVFADIILLTLRALNSESGMISLSL